MVALGASNTVEVQLSNVGSRPAEFTIEYDEVRPHPRAAAQPFQSRGAAWPGLRRRRARQRLRSGPARGARSSQRRETDRRGGARADSWRAAAQSLPIRIFPKSGVSP